MSIERRCRREIDELHDFFEDWFNGDIEQSSETFERFESVIAPGFVLIDLEGAAVPRDQLVPAIRDRWGHRDEQDEPIAIDTDAIELLRSEGELHLVTYIEHQRVGDSSNDRRSSVLFRESDGAPNGLEWLHVHETLIE